MQAAGLLALIGVFDLIGVTTSGWLTDRWDPARLLFAFYALRGLSLFFLPLVLGETALGMAAFVVVFGLDWVATVPPTVALTVGAFGREQAGVVFGWIFAAHQLGRRVRRVGGRPGSRVGRHLRPGLPRHGTPRDHGRGADPGDGVGAPGAADRDASGDDDGDLAPASASAVAMDTTAAPRSTVKPAWKSPDDATAAARPAAAMPPVYRTS